MTIDEIRAEAARHGCVVLPVRDGLIVGHSPLTIPDDYPSRDFAVHIDCLSSDEASVVLQASRAIRALKDGANR